MHDRRAMVLFERLPTFCGSLQRGGRELRLHGSTRLRLTGHDSARTDGRRRQTEMQGGGVFENWQTSFKGLHYATFEELK